MQHCFVLSSFARMEVPIFVQVMRIVIITSYPTPHRYMQIHILTYHVLSVDPGSICKINNSKSISEMVLTALFNYTIWFPSSVGCIRQCWLLRCIVICWKVCRRIKFILSTSVPERQKETKWSKPKAGQVFWNLEFPLQSHNSTSAFALRLLIETV